MAECEGHTFFEGRITVVFNDAGLAVDIDGNSFLDADDLHELVRAAVTKKLKAAVTPLN